MEWRTGRDSSRSLFDEAVRWIVAIRAGSAADADVVEWATRSPDHVEAFLEAWDIWRLLEGVTHEQRAHIDELAENLTSGNVVSLGDCEAPHIPKRTSRLSRYHAVATLIAMVCTGVGLCAFFSSQPPRAVYETGNEAGRFLLSDGSTIHLNRLTQVRTQFREGVRDLELLRGEALFDVAHDVDRPFRVRSGDSMVQAIGTQFDVRRRGENLEVLVTSGRVAFSADSRTELSGAALTLSGGQALSVRSEDAARAVEVRMLTTRERLQLRDWTLGRIELHGTSIREAAERFNQYNQTQLVIDDEDIGRFHLGGNFRLSGPNDFAKALRSFGIGVRTDSSAPGVLHLYRVLPDEARKIGSAALSGSGPIGEPH